MVLLKLMAAASLLAATLSAGTALGLVGATLYDENLFPPDSNCIANRCLNVTDVRLADDGDLQIQVSVYRPSGPYLLGPTDYRLGYVHARLRQGTGLPLAGRALMPNCTSDNSDTGTVRGECLIEFRAGELRKLPASGEYLTLDLNLVPGSYSLGLVMP